MMSSASDFQRLYNAVSTNLKKITNNTNDLEDLVRKLGTAEDSEPLRDRYYRIQHETKTLMEQLHTDVKKLAELHMGIDDERRKKLLLDSFSKKYPEILNRFQEIQRTGVRKEKESIERARAVTYRSPDGSGSQFDNNLSSGNQGQQQVVLPMDQQANLQGINERADQLRQLETDIVQINDLFRDVHTLVHDQGDIIQNIEEHTYQTEKQVEVANKQLDQALTYQTAARRKKIILITVLIIIIVIVVLVLGIYFGTKK